MNEWTAKGGTGLRARKKRKMTFRAMWNYELREIACRDYLETTTPIFTPEMGARFRKARIEMEKTQQEMADLFGISQTVISRIESGRIIHTVLTSLQFRNVLKNRFDEVVVGGRFMKDFGITYHYDKQMKRWVGELKK